MQQKQTIVIIGATGSMGSAIAKSLAKGSNRLLLFSNHPEQSKALAEQISTADSVAEAIDCSYNASWEADIIILAVPYGAEKELAEKIRQVSSQKIIISISNPVNEDFSGLVTDPSTSAAEELQKLLPHSKVVKAFNTTFAADFSTPVINGLQADAFVAGNDNEAVKTVVELVKTAGFNPVVAGDLTVSGTLERMQLLLMQLTMKNNYNWLAGWKILHQ